MGCRNQHSCLSPPPMGVVDLLSFLQECRTRQNSFEMSLSDEERDSIYSVKTRALVILSERHILKEGFY